MSIWSRYGLVNLRPHFPGPVRIEIRGSLSGFGYENDLKV